MHSGTCEITHTCYYCIQTKKRLAEARKKRVIESDEDDISPADDIAAAALIEHTAASEKSKPVRSGGDSSGRRRSARTASQIALARNRVLLSENATNSEVYINDPWRLYDARVFKWIPFQYGDERDKRQFTYGDDNEGERHYARVISYNEPFWRIEYECDGETEDCTLAEILENLVSMGDSSI